jgi:glycosyltransferase involved in cell wall biosynthesis
MTQSIASGLRVKPPTSVAKYDVGALTDLLESLPITVVVPTHNEEKNLALCLSNLIGFHQVVVVDSQSTDRTREIAESAGAKVIQFEWRRGYPKKRNWMLLNYSFDTPWVLFVDADEHLTEAFRREVALKLKNSDYVGFWLTYTNHFQGKLLRHGVVQRKLALFRVGAGVFERIEDSGWSNLDMEVHEHPVLSGAIGEITAPIEHLDFKGMKHFIQRHNEYSTWEALRYLSLTQMNSVSLTPRQKLKYQNIERWWYPFGYFTLTYFVKLGFLDGRPGFVYAMMKFMYFMEIQEKIREMRLEETKPKA